VTKRDNFVAIAEILEGLGEFDLAESVLHEVDLLDKRKSAPRKPTAAQLENVELKSRIVVNLPDEGLTATEIAGRLDKTVQKTSQLLRQLVDEGRVDKIPAKGKEKARFLPV
jgi:predicted Rossmann fold nucleotide-binding protein DprA/Smf involved in DNA uptake